MPNQTKTPPSPIQTVLPGEPKCDELVLLINSCSPIIAVETSEEDRLEELVIAAAAKLP